MDLRIVKYFPFGGLRRLDFVAEAFNLFNRPNVAQINPVFGPNLSHSPDSASPSREQAPAKFSSPWTTSSEDYEV